MGIKLDVRKCNESCRYYLKMEGEVRAICTYEDNKDVITESRCKYEFLTTNSARKLPSSPEEKLLRATYGVELEITLTEAREQLGLSN